MGLFIWLERGSMFKNKYNGFERWILKLDERGEIQITKKYVTKHVPINRMLEEAGFYDYEMVQVKDAHYVCITKPSERDTIKSVIMVGRFESDGQGITMSDMTLNDLKNLDWFKKQYFSRSDEIDIKKQWS